jgi:hypothetical protein
MPVSNWVSRLAMLEIPLAPGATVRSEKGVLIPM